MKIVVALFDRLTALDAIGPYEALQRLPGATVTFVGKERGEYRSENGFLGLIADQSFAECTSADVMIMPGGVGTRRQEDDEETLEWIRAIHETTKFTTSVCTGSIALAAAGLLEGLTATTYWSEYKRLEQYGATATSQRVVEHLDERIITAAGVSSGIDMALRLSELLVDDVAARAMQLAIEYDPQPPFGAGNVEAAGPEVMARLLEYSKDKN